MKVPFTKMLSLALLAIAPLGAYAQFTGDTYAAAKSSKSATLSLTYVETPGFASKKSEGVEGLCVDLMEEFARYVKEKEGIAIKYRWQLADDPRDFARFMKNMASAKAGVFGLGNITITEDRKQQFNFSPPFINNVTVMISNNSVPTLTEITEISTAFAGMYAITVKGTTNEQYILEIKKKYWPSLEVRHTASSIDLVDIVKNDPKAFSNMDFTYYIGVLKNHVPIKRHPVADDSSEEFGIIMPKSNDWSPLMANFINEFKGTTEYDILINKHLGKNALALIKAVSSQ